jgi:hypothetical protein
MNLLSTNELIDEFQLNIDDIATNLIGTFSLKFKQEVPNLSSPLLRWLDFRLRYVDPQPRQIAFSRKFPKRGLPDSTKKAFKKFCERIEKGGDINPYQGRGLILRNDFSGDRNDTRTDLLWADWGIHHFHLSNEPLSKDQYFSRSADYLAFCLVGGNLIAFIDILRHPDKKEGFANPELIRTVASSWPDYMAQFKLNGIAAGRQHHTQTEIHSLRANGCSPSLNIKNVAYFSPGMGITSAATPLRVTLSYDRVRELTRDLARCVCDAGGPFCTPEISALKSPPKFSLIYTPSGLAVFEAHARHTFLLPEALQNKEPTPWEALHDLILPKWALKALLSSNT